MYFEDGDECEECGEYIAEGDDYGYGADDGLLLCGDCADADDFLAGGSF